MDTPKLLENIKIIMAAMMELNPSLKKPIDVLKQELIVDAYHEVYTMLDGGILGGNSAPKTDS